MIPPYPREFFKTIVMVLCGAGLASCGGESKITEVSVGAVLSPSEELSTFELQKGLKIELVASEPMVEDPILIEFDPAGRMWVVEMRGFMPDVEGNGETDPTGRVSILVDSNGDGRMDDKTVYLDSLVLPRAMALVKGGILIAENEALWFAPDRNQDLKADDKILIDPDYAGNSTVEHAGNGLLRGIDNWYYNARSRFRYKQVGSQWIRDTTEFRGQWGLSKDDEGRFFYNYNWSQLHGDLVPPNYLSKNKNHKPSSGIDHGLTTDRRIYPIRDNPAVNRGYIPGTLDDEGKLKEFTAACSPFYYRSDALPGEYYGNVFVAEPSGNLVKRNIVKEDQYLLTAYDPTPGKEFLASYDERFRPVSFATGPDGALYVVDMYRGIVQHGPYMTDYLKEQTLERNLDKPINLGRIWRITPTGWEPKPVPDLSQRSTEELVMSLKSRNGWVRDVAQRLLIELEDDDAVELLADMAANHSNQWARLHAIWTLEGLDALTPETLLETLDDESVEVRNATLRLMEGLLIEYPDLVFILDDNNSDPSAFSDKELLQRVLSSRKLDDQSAFPIFEDALNRPDSIGLMRDAILSSLSNREYKFLEFVRSSEAWNESSDSKSIFLETLATAILNKGNSTEMEKMLASLYSTERQDWKNEAILNAISLKSMSADRKPYRLSSAPAIVTSSSILTDKGKQSIYALFEWPGHKASTRVTQAGSVLDEEQREQFLLGRKNYLTTCAGCHGNDGNGMDRLAPPLAGSEWVTGDEIRLVLLVLHGIEGPIQVKGKTYDAPDIMPVMPAHSTLDDGKIASILTYIRNEWGNSSGAVSRRTVGRTRHTSQGNVLPWSVDELNAHIDKLNQTKSQDSD